MGSLCATLGAILPSFVIVLIITALVSNFLEYNGVKAFLGGVRPAIIALIIGTSITMFLSTVFSYKIFGDPVNLDFKALVIFLILVASSLIYKKIKKEEFRQL